MAMALPVREIPLPDAAAGQAHLDRATAAHEAGRLEDAKRAYLEALTANPYSPEAEHGLAWLHAQQGDWVAAMPRFARAIKLRPWEKEYWISQLEALLQVGHVEAVHRVLHRALQSGLPAAVGDTFEKRLHERRLGFLTERVRASGKSPEKASQAPHGELMALREAFVARRFAEAQAMAERLVQRYPLCAFAWRVLGASHPVADLERGGLEALRIACDLDPSNVDVVMNLAIALNGLGRIDEAESAYAKVLALQPDNVRALVNQGLLMMEAKRPNDAEALLRRARALGATDPRVAYALGIFLRTNDRGLEAVPLLEEALVAAPDQYSRNAELAIACLMAGKHERAAELFWRLRGLKPDNLMAVTAALFCATHIPEVTPEELFDMHRHFGELVEDGVTAFDRHENQRDPDRKLRVGFVSGDLSGHAVASFIAPVWEAMDRTRFEIHAYSSNDKADATTEHLRKLCDGWRDISALSDEVAAEKIRQDGIDILVDLSGHTSFNRLALFALKPAPVQATWIGYPATTGLSRIDYYIANVFWASPGLLDDQFTEKLMFLPSSAAFTPSPHAPPIAALPCRGRGHFTFGSFNRVNKISPATVRLWSRILRSVDGSRMIIGAMEGDGVERLSAQFLENGVDPARIEFVGRSGYAQYLGKQAQVDVNLDAVPYAGGTTTYHALWMGVPTVVLAGRTLPARVGSAIMSAVGLSSFIAEDDDAYVRLAVEWANPARWADLAEIRASARTRMQGTCVGDSAMAIHGFEDGIRSAWRRWCEGLPPESMVVERRRDS